jgi:hypothetical protein
MTDRASGLGDQNIQHLTPNDTEAYNEDVNMDENDEQNESRVVSNTVAPETPHRYV